MILGEWNLDLYRDLRRLIRDHRRNHLNSCTSDSENVEHSIGSCPGFRGRTTWDDDISSRFVGYVFSVLFQHAGAEKLKTREYHGDENDHRNSRLDRGSPGATVSSSS